SYTLDATPTRAVAYCSGQVVMGQPDAALSPATFDLAQGYDMPRLGPSGTLYVRHPGPTPTFYAFHYQVGTWTADQVVTFVNYVPDEIGVPTDGGVLDRHMMIVSGGELWEFQVVSEDPSAMTWNIVNGGFAASSVGLTSFADPMLSPDGLRLVFTGTTGGTSD